MSVSDMQAVVSSHGNLTSGHPLGPKTSLWLSLFRDLAADAKKEQVLQCLRSLR